MWSFQTSGTTHRIFAVFISLDAKQWLGCGRFRMAQFFIPRTAEQPGVRTDIGNYTDRSTSVFISPIRNTLDGLWDMVQYNSSTLQMEEQLGTHQTSGTPVRTHIAVFISLTSDNGWVVGGLNSGTILHTTNGGANLDPTDIQVRQQPLP